MKPVPIEKVLDGLAEEVEQWEVPVVEFIKIQNDDPYRILVATILSARTRDETTAQVCKRLFTAAPTMHALEKLSIKEIEQLIFPVGFFRQKAVYLKQLPVALNENFHGEIPPEIDDLCTLPGVGRKTANLVTNLAFNKPGICVDVHVHRIMNRLGYIRTSTPLETEMMLRKKLPKTYWSTVNRILVAFGQHLCKPIYPHCDVCPVYKYCNRVSTIPRKLAGKKNEN